MYYRITTITDEELREFERLATAHGKYRENFRIRQRDGSSAVEILYKPRFVEREYERSGSARSWLRAFEADLKSGYFDVVAMPSRPRRRLLLEE